MNKRKLSIPERMIDNIMHKADKVCAVCWEKYATFGNWAGEMGKDGQPTCEHYLTDVRIAFDDCWAD